MTSHHPVKIVLALMFVLLSTLSDTCIADGVSCSASSGNITGNVDGDVLVDVNCTIRDSYVDGSVIVRRGRTLDVANGMIRGDLLCKGRNLVGLSDSVVHGNSLHCRLSMAESKVWGTQTNRGITLVRNGMSYYSIYHAADAPQSVKEAASELQRIVKISSGVELPIVQEVRKHWRHGVISLGQNEYLKKARIDSSDLSVDSYKIIVKNRSVFIFGNDADENDSPWVGWDSRGTLYGVYDFLERVIGVRWLMPCIVADASEGTTGAQKMCESQVDEDIPSKRTVIVPRLKVHVVPSFSSRGIFGLLQGDGLVEGEEYRLAVKGWLQHQRAITEENRYRFYHAADNHIKPCDALLDLYRIDRPLEDQCSLSDDNREGICLPVDSELCTEDPSSCYVCSLDFGKQQVNLANQLVVENVVAGVKQWFDDHPTTRMAEISLADGDDGLCGAPRGDQMGCQACPGVGPEQDPHGEVSSTRRVMTYYNAVAREIASDEKYEGRLLGAFAYRNYTYPARDPGLELEPNIVIAWTPLNYYGRMLEHETFRNEIETIAKEWASSARHFVYHNWSTWMRSFHGAPLPPGFNIFELELPAVQRAGAEAAFMWGMYDWGTGAMNNYILARQLWNTSIDVRSAYEEWLQLAYGPGWSAIDQMYQLIEARLVEYKKKQEPKYHGWNYEVNYPLLRDVYEPLIEEIAAYYFEAYSKAATEAQQQRLKMLGYNLQFLHFSLRKFGMIEDSQASGLFRSDEDMEMIFEAFNNGNLGSEFTFFRHNGNAHYGPIWCREWDERQWGKEWFGAVDHPTEECCQCEENGQCIDLCQE